MATIAAARSPASAVPATSSEQSTASPPLPKTRNLHRPTSYAHNRLSQMSTSSRRSKSGSRPTSQAIPAYQSSLDYTLVRDFAYPASHSLYCGPPLTASNRSSQVSSPTQESSSETLGDSIPWDQSRGGDKQREQFEGPWSEDEDLQSPVVIQTRHRRTRGNGARRRQEGSDRADRVIVRGYGPDVPSHLRSGVGEEADSIDTNLQTPNQVRRSRFDQGHFLARHPSDPDAEDDDEEYGSSDEKDENRYSRDYQFTIASPDEEMHGKAVALFNFQSENENELPLTEGQIVWVSYRHEQGWLVAEDPNTRESGLVPEEYVRLLRDIKGGLSGLHGEQNQDSGEEGDVTEEEEEQEDEDESQMANRDDVATPTQGDHGGNFAQLRGTQEGHASTTGDPPKSSGSGSGYQATLSTFSTSSKDLEGHQHLLGEKQGGQPPQRMQHRGNNQTLPPTAAESPSKSKSGRNDG